MNPVKKAKLLLFIRLFAESLCLPYISLFLTSKGYDSSQIGIVIGLIPLTALVCAPIYSRVFNTPVKAKTALMIMSALEAVIVILLLFFNQSFAAVVTIIVLMSIVSSSNYGLIDSLLGLICTENGITYGKVRIFGGIAYLAGSFIMFGSGLIFNEVNYRLVFIVAAALYVVVSVLYIFVKAPEPEKKNAKQKISIKGILCDKRFMGYVLFYVMLIGSMQVCDDFYSMYLLSETGVDYLYSIVMLGFVAIEITTMALLNKFAKPKLSLMYVAVSVLAVRLILQSIPVLPTWGLIASQLTRGITWGITLFVSTQYIISILGFERSTTGIVLCSFFVSVFTSVFKLCGGYIIAAIGYPAFYMIFAIIVCVAVAYLAIYKKFTDKKELPLAASEKSE